MSRQVYYAESLGEDTTTSGTYQDKTTLTFTPDANQDYIIFWSADVIALSTADDVFTRLYNSTDAVVLSEQNQENRTTGNTPYRMAHGFAKYSAGASPASTSFKIQYYSENSSITSKIRNARILAVRVESDDEYAESLSDQTVTSNTYVDGATLTFTPPSQGDYLVFAACDWNHGSTADIAYIHLLNPSSTSIGEMRHINRDAANYNPYTTMVKENLTASSKTYKIQIHRTSTNTITVRNQRLFAMRLDTFANTYYAEDRTRATTTSTTYQDDNSLTQTTNAADHLIFNVAGGDGSSNGTSNYLQFLEDGSTMCGPASTRVNVTGTYSNYYTSFIAYKATLTNASHTWKRQFKTDLPATAGIDEDATAVLEYTTGNAYTLTCDYGSFTLSGQAAALKKDSQLVMAQASFTLTGQAVNLLHGYTLSLTHGSFTLSGQTAGLTAQRLITAVQASYTLSGQAATLQRNCPLTADYGSFTLTGQDANLTSARKLTADYGSFTVTGQVTSLIADRLLTAAQGGFTLTGQDANLAQGYGFTVDYGSFTLTGQDAALKAGYKLTADYGSFTLSGQDAVLTSGEILTADQATFTLTGQDAALTAGRILAADYAAFTLTGQDIAFSYTPSAGQVVQQGGGFAVYDRDAARRTKKKQRDKLKKALDDAVAALNPVKAEPEVKTIIKAVKQEAERLDDIPADLLVTFDFLPLQKQLEALQELIAERQAMLEEEEAIAILLATIH